MLLSLAVLFWAGNSVVGRAFAGDIPPIALVFWRWVIAILILLPLGYKTLVRDFGVIKANWKYIAFQGFLSITCFNTFLYWGLHYTTVVNTSLVQAGLPVMTLLFSWFLLRKGVDGRGALGIVISLLGVSWVVIKGDLGHLTAVQFNPGDLLILVAMILWAIYSVMLAKVPEGLNRMAFTIAMMIVGLLFLVPAYGWEIAHSAGFELTQETLLAFAYTGVFPSVLALLFWNKGVEAVGANVAGIFINLMPVFGAILGLVLLGEQLVSYHFIGIVAIFAGVALVTVRRKG